jgi:hypothetical protein
MYTDWKQRDEIKPCQLNLAESYDLEPDGQGHMFIPFMMDKRRRLIVDTGGARSELYSSVVDELHLETHDAEDFGWRNLYGTGDQVGFSGNSFDKVTQVPEIWVGPVPYKNATFVVLPDSRRAPLADNEIAGLLGPSHLMSFDLEFDFAARKLNMFLQNDCIDHVVYWAKYYSVIPFDLDENGHILLPVNVDGVAMTAILDTGAPSSLMFLDAAERSFGLTKKSLKAENVNDSAPSGEDGNVFLHHRFKRISMNSVDILNPDLIVAPNNMSERPSVKMPQLIIGLQELSVLRLFIAYSQNQLYVTAKDAH